MKGAGQVSFHANKKQSNVVTTIESGRCESTIRGRLKRSKNEIALHFFYFLLSRRLFLIFYFFSPDPIFPKTFSLKVGRHLISARNIFVLLLGTCVFYSALRRKPWRRAANSHQHDHFFLCERCLDPADLRSLID